MYIYGTRIVAHLANYPNYLNIYMCLPFAFSSQLHATILDVFLGDNGLSAGYLVY